MGKKKESARKKDKLDKKSRIHKEHKVANGFLDGTYIDYTKIKIRIERYPFG